MMLGDDMAIVGQAIPTDTGGTSQRIPALNAIGKCLHIFLIKHKDFPKIINPCWHYTKS